MNSQDTSELLDLLEEISVWMVDNDYECGARGAVIFERIHAILQKHGRDDEG